MSRAVLIVRSAAYRLTAYPCESGRLFRLDHQSKLDSLEDAFRVLGAPLRLDVPFPELKAA